MMGMTAMLKSLEAFAMAAGLLMAGAVHAQQDGRPPGLNLANFQYAPYNRWGFSHVREVIPTANIAHDNQRVLALGTSPGAGQDVSFLYRGRQQQLDAIAAEQFIDGILVTTQ